MVDVIARRRLTESVWCGGASAYLLIETREAKRGSSAQKVHNILPPQSVG